MTLTLTTFLIVCPMVFLAGFVDAIGGGGGLISLPAYLLAGLPPHMALATNKLSAATGTVVATGRYVRKGCMNKRAIIPCIVFALLGAQIGARLALKVPEDVFRIVLLVMLPVIAMWVLFRKDLSSKQKEKLPLVKELLLVSVVSLVIGVYDGFYGPGTGTFLLLCYTGLCRMDVLEAAGNVKIANLASNISSLAVFLFSGNVIVLLGLTASLFSIAGNYIGAGLAIKKGGKFVRIIILCVIVLLAVKVISELV